MKLQYFKFVTFLVLVLFKLPSYSQSPTWAWGLYGNGYDEDLGRCIVQDSSGNFYVAGEFKSNPFVFQSVTTVLNFGPGYRDIFIVKYSPSGSMIWSRTFEGMSEDYVTGMALDGDGNLIITGYFNSSSLKLYNQTLFHAPNGYDEMFVAKPDSAGNTVWAQNYRGTNGTSNSVRGRSAAVDGMGNFYIAGEFECYYLDLDGTILTNSSSGPFTSDIFLAKFDPLGNLIWARKEGGTYIEKAFDIASSLDGEVCLAGGFTSGTLVLGSTTLYNVGGSEAFTAKYDSSGNLLWAKGTNGVNYEEAKAIGMDAQGDVYVAGTFESLILNLGTDTLFAPNNNTSSPDVFLVKYSANGTIAWVSHYEHLRNPVMEVQPNGDHYLSGLGVAGTMFGNILLPVDGTLVGKNDLAGNAQWVKQLVGLSQDDIFGMVSDDSGSVIVTGGFRTHSLSFGTFTLTNSNLGNMMDYFAAKLVGGTATGIENGVDGAMVQVYPNPTAETIYFDRAVEEITLTNFTGQVLKTQRGQFTELYLGDLPNGVYLLRSMTSGEMETHRIVLHR